MHARPLQYMQKNPWPFPANGKHYLLPEIAQLLSELPDMHGLRGDYIAAARAAGHATKSAKHYYEAVKRHRRDPGSVCTKAGKPRILSRVSATALATANLAAGGPTLGFTALRTLLDDAKREQYRRKGGVGHCSRVAINTARVAYAEQALGMLTHANKHYIPSAMMC